MIIENPYHRRKVKKILQENKFLKEENAKLRNKTEYKKNPYLDGLIEEQIEEIKKLKQKIQGYKMQNAKLRKQIRG